MLIIISIKAHSFLHQSLLLDLQQPVHFWLHVLLDHQNPKANYCGEFHAMK